MLWLTVICIHSVIAQNLIHVAGEKDAGNEISREISSAHIISHKLNKYIWEDDEEPCVAFTKTMFNELKNHTLWATWVWDAMQRPLGALYGSRYHFGNYDQCLKSPWRDTHPELATQYCVVDAKFISSPKEHQGDINPFSDTLSYLQTETKQGRHLNVQTLSLCVSTKCKTKTVKKLAKIFLEEANLPIPNYAEYDVRYCDQTDGSEKQYNFGTKIFYMLTFSLISITILSTIIVNNNNKTVTNSILTKIASSFDIKKNFDALFDVHKEEILVLNGMRFITAVAVIFVHVSIFPYFNGILNSLDIDRFLVSSAGYISYHVDLIVDTFFTISGLLLSISLLSGSKKNLYMMPLKRYIRLSGVFLFLVFYMTVVDGEYNCGPIIYFYKEFEQQLCLKSWWKNLLMINLDVKELCNLVTWYIMCDYQLSLWVILLALLYVHHKKSGIVMFTISYLLALWIPGFITYWYSLPAVIFPKVQLAVDMRSHELLNYKYFKSYLRGGAYLTGVAMGYFMWQNKPSKHRNIISKYWSNIVCAIAVLVLCISFAFGKVMKDRPYNPIEAGLYASVERTIWSIAICMIIGVCEYGDVSYVKDILSSRTFIPLSKLSYGIYLIHPFLIWRYLYKARAPFFYDFYSLMCVTLGVLMMAILLSLVLWLLIEAPLYSITAQFLSGSTLRSPKQCENAVTKIDNMKQSKEE